MLAGTMFAVWLRIAAMSPARISATDAPGYFADAVAAVDAEGGTADELGLVATAGVCEGGGRRTAVGALGEIGTTQLMSVLWRGHGRDEVLADRVLQLRLWILALRDAVSRCGTVERAIGALSTDGTCGGAPKLSHRRATGRC
jgi:hypothetical protein